MICSPEHIFGIHSLALLEEAVKYAAFLSNRSGCSQPLIYLSIWVEYYKSFFALHFSIPWRFLLMEARLAWDCCSFNEFFPSWRDVLSQK